MSTQRSFDRECAAVLAREESRQRLARSVLEQLAPLDRWRAHGAPRLCGAMSYGLLVAPDIDIEVFGEAEVAGGFALMGEWAQDSAVRRVLFLNALGDADGGLGWELRYRYEGGPWTVQMWLLPEDYPGPRSADLVEPMRAALTPRTRCAILRIKEDLVRTGTRYRSIDVYRAVLDDGIADVHDYRQWCRGNASVGLLGWRPVSRGRGARSPALTSGRAPESPAGPAPAGESAR